MTTLTRMPGFLPFVAVVFLNSFVDLGHKIIIQNTLFKAYDGPEQIWLTALVNALILLPFILLFTPSGWLADRWPKNRVMRLSAWVAVGITLGITLCYYLGLFWPAFVMTFVLALQSAIYSPSKFGYIKELCGTEALTPANAWVQASSSIAILAGILSFSVLFEMLLAGPAGEIGGTGLAPDEILRRVAPVGWFLVLGSLVEVAMAYRLPDKRPGDPALRFHWGQYLSGRYLRHNLHAAWDNQVIWLSIIGLGVFWGISQVLLAAFPAFVEDNLGETNTVVIQGVMAFAGIGIIVGAAIAGRIARDHVETGLIPFSALGIAATLFVLPMIGVTWLHGLNFMALGLLAGMFIVPLNALIQFNAGERELGRVLAAKNFILNWIMLGGLIVTVASALADAGSRAIMVALAVVALVGAVYTVLQLPQSLMRFFIGRVMATRYRLSVIGLDNLPAQGGVLMLGNHISWIDWAMVQMASPRPVRFVMERVIYERWWLKWFLDVFGVVPISRAGSRDALNAVTDLINQGQVVCVFPEGTLSKNAQLGEFKRGFELAAAGADGVILPFYLRGLWGSRFSNASEKLKESRRGRVRDVIVAFGAPLPITSNAQRVKQAVFELSVSSWAEHVRTLPTLPAAWLAVARQRLGAPMVLDSTGAALTNRRLIAAVLLFARAIARRCPEQNVGILLPASSAYTASPDALAAALASAGIRHVVTAERFLRKLGQRGIDAEAASDGGHPRRHRPRAGARRARRRHAAADLAPAAALRPPQAPGGHRRDPVLLRQRGCAEGRGADAPQHSRERAADRGRAKHRNRRPDAVQPAAVPRLRSHGDHRAAAAGGHPDGLSPGPHRCRRQRQGHRPLPRHGAVQHQEPQGASADAGEPATRRCRRRAAVAGRARRLCREVRQAHLRGLRRHRNHAGGERERAGRHRARQLEGADGEPSGHRRHAAARHELPHRGPGHARPAAHRRGRADPDRRRAGHEGLPQRPRAHRGGRR